MSSPSLTRPPRQTRSLAGCWFVGGLCATLSPVLAALDADNNQLSDVWQRRYVTGSSAATADPDGDGYSNATECLFATNPFDAASRPGFDFSSASGSASAAWQGEPGKKYLLEKSGDLTGWATHLSPVGNGKPLSATVTADPGAALFLRLGATDLDADGDGLTDWEERSSVWGRC